MGAPVDAIDAGLKGLSQAHLVAFVSQTSLSALKGLASKELKGRSLTEAVSILFPEYSPAQTDQLARQLALTAFRNSCWKVVAEVPAPMTLVIRTPDEAATLALRKHQGPAILAFWHFGAVNMLLLGFRRIGISPLVITRAEPCRWVSSEEMMKQRISVADGDTRAKTAALRRSVQHLKRGGMISVAIDGSLGNHDVAVPFLGRQFSVSRGAAGLSRITGAPIIPCTMQWEPDGWNMAIRVFDALPRPAASPDDAEAFEHELMTSAARCFEQYAEQNPGQLRLDQFAKLVDAPRL